MRPLALLFLMLASSAFGARYAVVVGIDKYPFITSPTRQLRGAETDTRLMTRMLDLYGFQTTVLLREEATKAKIGDALKSVLERAKKGDSAVLYFSGRGAVAEDPSDPGSGLEPTLVPADSAFEEPGGDIRMRWIEEWAGELRKREVQPTVIVDASYQDPTRSDYGRQYNPTPRSVARPFRSEGEVRDVLYRGAGVFLSACPAKGAAYEWLASSSEERWGGAFTDQLVNAVVAALNRGENPTALDAMREVQAYFKDKVRTDYMPGLAPYPFMERLMTDSLTYDQPLFGGVDPKSLPAGSKASLAAMERDRRERERKLRVALEVTDASSEPDRQKLYDRASKELSEYLSKQVPNTEFAPTGAPPDVIVRVKPYSGQMEASVTGDDLDKTRVFVYRAKNLGGALKEGLGSFLALRGLVTRLYRITATQSPTWSESLELTTDGGTYSRGDTFGLDLKGPNGALLYILNRDDADGVLQLAFPQPGAPYSQKLNSTLRMGGQIQNDTQTGRMLLRAIVVPSEAIPEVPMADDKKFREALVKQLRMVVDGMETGKIPWTTKTINLRIR